jgi:APA family basic amino acid/polyamine antiporter
VLRRRHGAPRDGYRMPLYPWLPALFILVTAGLVFSDLTASGWRAWAGVGIAATGVPAYLLWKRGRRPRAPGDYS